MKIVTIEPISKPASFADVKFTEADWKAANKAGAKTVSYGTAMENIRNSQGLYKIKAETKAEIAIKGLKDPEEMTSSELVAEMTTHGKPPRKKMNRKVAIDFVKKLRAEAEAFIVEEDEGDE